MVINKLLMEKGFSLIEMVRTTGKGQKTIIQYRDLILLYHPDLGGEDGFSEASEDLSTDD